MKNIILSILLFFTLSGFAQQTLKGKVVDAETGKGLAGASVSFGSNSGTSTDADGNFSIDCSKTKKITITFVGYEPYSVTIKNCDDQLKVSLQSTGRTLDNVEISSTASTDKKLLYQPASITRLNTLELKRGQNIFLQDVIETSVPGVIMNRRTVSGGQQFNIRGYGNGARGTNGVNSNFDGQGYKVYINGIPLTDAEGITTLDDIDYASLGNVEILKGPAGTLYGQAISGAISFRTIKPEAGRTSISQDIMFGNYGLQ